MSTSCLPLLTQQHQPNHSLSTFTLQNTIVLPNEVICNILINVSKAPQHLSVASMAWAKERSKETHTKQNTRRIPDHNSLWHLQSNWSYKSTYNPYEFGMLHHSVLSVSSHTRENRVFKIANVPILKSHIAVLTSKTVTEVDIISVRVLVASAWLALSIELHIHLWDFKNRDLIAGSYWLY